ncbi:hypothetical protein ACFSKN_08455 [Mariniflexile gromovii]|uniref:KTSC domain-containing protein n=1 Tax=Mariniflexile gromovii TaxID=362523 RepID=A0ABS4BU63_9FLAO|nr:hypothetical protein [Mariniflexile gromovii]MBP0904118.1 hypothetical protein [Mariniflexile gromovii]
MIRLHLKSAILKSLNFNKKDKTLEIEFKDGIKTTDCMDIPISILEDYVNSIKQNGGLCIDEDHRSNLKIVYSNFAS